MTDRRPWYDPRRVGGSLAARSRQGVRRVRGSILAILQSALAATLAWVVAEQLLGRPSPLFAPIAAWVCLGFKVDRVPRKVLELGVGATAGVLVGEVLAVWFGVGWWQVGLALIVGAVLGRFLDRGDLTTIQGGVNAMVVVSMSWLQVAQGGFTGRWVEAIVGSGVAFVFAVLLPRDPTSRPRRYARNTLNEFATLLGMVGRGLSAGDVELLEDAREQRRTVVEVRSDWEETLITVRSVVTFNPRLRSRRDEVAELDRLFRLTGRAQRSAAMLARQGLSMVEEVGALPDIGSMLIDLSAATHAVSGSVTHWTRPERARQILGDVAARATPFDAFDQGDWRPVALMSLVRALVVDLLQISGTSNEVARDLLPDTWGRPFGEHQIDVPASDSDDAASPLWGP